MSTFSVKLTRIRAIEPIANADAIELAVVGDYRSVVRKEDFSVDELVVYVPEASIVPDYMLKSMGLEGRLAGADKNRVKAVKLRGCLSQGLCYPVRQLKSTTAAIIYNEHGDTIVAKEGENVAELLGVKKWEPQIPQQFAGELYSAQEFTVHYDIENFKAFPDILVPGEEVVMTEKLHGSFCGVGVLPSRDASDKHWHGQIVVFSKGLGARGLCLLSTERNHSNTYIRALMLNNLFDNLIAVARTVNSDVGPVFFLGEVFGPGVQDLRYGNKLSYRVFDICMGRRGTQKYLSYEEMKRTCTVFGFDMVPEIYRGPFSAEIMKQHTDGKETLSGSGLHIREGVVIKPVVEREHHELGRVILKSVSGDYLTRKGETTEFQ